MVVYRCVQCQLMIYRSHVRVPKFFFCLWFHTETDLAQISHFEVQFQGVINELQGQNR